MVKPSHKVFYHRDSEFNSIENKHKRDILFNEIYDLCKNYPLNYRNIVHVLGLVRHSFSEEYNNNGGKRKC